MSKATPLLKETDNEDITQKKELCQLLNFRLKHKPYPYYSIKASVILISLL